MDGYVLHVMDGCHSGAEMSLFYHFYLNCLASLRIFVFYVQINEHMNRVSNYCYPWTLAISAVCRQFLPYNYNSKEKKKQCS